MRSQNWILWCRLQVHVRLKRKLNEVLLAMDIEDNRIEGSVRLSMGETTTEKDIEQFKDKFKLIYAQIKELLK